MAPKIPGLSIFTSADAKTRVMMLLGALVAIGVIIYVGIRFFTNATQTTGPSQVAAPPAGLQSVPGAQMTPEFYRAVVQANTQAAQQAQITGGSAVPTLINVPGQMDNQCGVICPQDASFVDKINELIRAGRLAQDEANRLIELAKNNVTPEEMTSSLNRLISQGKLSPDDARALLEAYKKQYRDALAAESAKLMDGLLKSGKLPLDATNRLLTLQRNNASPNDYAEELRRMAAANTITPQTAAQLLAQYQELQRRECLKQNAFNIRQMQQAGQLTPEVEKSLQELQGRNVTIVEYTGEVNKLLSAGKMTPEVAGKLIDNYNKCVSAGGVSALNAIDALIAQEEAKCNAELKAIAVKNRWPAAVLNNVETLKQRNVSPAAFQAAIAELQRAGRLTPEDARSVVACYERISALKGMAQRLMGLQRANASAANYGNELNRNVEAGLITPQQAAALLQAYQQPTQGALPTVETSIPGTEGFAALQQRLDTEAPAPAESPEAAAAAQQFASDRAQAAAAAAEARLARIQALAGAMSTQAQSLVAAWTPPTMQVVVGQAADKPGVPGADGKETTTTTVIEKSGRERAQADGIPLIKAGTILYGILDTAVDSDYPDTPVMVTIVSPGPFKGARLLGKLNLAEGKDKVSLAFSLMDKEGWPRTKTISAFAIDPDTARTVMASSVNRHFLLRYGSLFAASLLSGYATAIMSSGSVQTNNANGSTVTRSQFSPREKLGVALGQFGTALSNVVSGWVNIPYTVRVNSGVGLGILFISDVAPDARGQEVVINER